MLQKLSKQNLVSKLIQRKFNSFCSKSKYKKINLVQNELSHIKKRNYSTKIPKISQNTLRKTLKLNFSTTVENQPPLSNPEDTLSNLTRSWLEEIKNLHWDKYPTNFVKINQESTPENPVELPHWFPNGELNIAYNCLVHNKQDDALAVSFSNLLGDGHGQLTYKQLRKKVNKTAGVLQSLGLVAQDKVIIMMSNSVEMVISMLACLQLGVVFKNLPPGLGPSALGEVLSLIKPKMLVIASSESRIGKKINSKNISRVLSSISLGSILSEKKSSIRILNVWFSKKK